MSATAGARAGARVAASRVSRPRAAATRSPACAAAPAASGTEPGAGRGGQAVEGGGVPGRAALRSHDAVRGRGHAVVRQGVDAGIAGRDRGQGGDATQAALGLAARGGHRQEQQPAGAARHGQGLVRLRGQDPHAHGLALVHQRRVAPHRLAAGGGVDHPWQRRRCPSCAGRAARAPVRHRPPRPGPGGRARAGARPGRGRSPPPGRRRPRPGTGRGGGRAPGRGPKSRRRPPPRRPCEARRRARTSEQRAVVGADARPAPPGPGPGRAPAWRRTRLGQRRARARSTSSRAVARAPASRTRPAATWLSTASGHVHGDAVVVGARVERVGQRRARGRPGASRRGRPRRRPAPAAGSSRSSTVKVSRSGVRAGPASTSGRSARAEVDVGRDPRRRRTSNSASSSTRRSRRRARSSSASHLVEQRAVVGDEGVVRVPVAVDQGVRG